MTWIDTLDIGWFISMNYADVKTDKETVFIFLEISTPQRQNYLI